MLLIPLALIFLISWVGSGVAFVVTRRGSSRTAVWSAGIWLAGNSFVALWVVFLMVSATQPRNVYQVSFGFPVSPDVTQLQSSYWYFGDTGVTYLKFKASPSTLKRILKRGLKPVAKEEFRQNSESLSGDDPPSWWQPFAGSSNRFYSARFKNRDFSSEEELLCYDKSSGLAHYRFVGID